MLIRHALAFPLCTMYSSIDNSMLKSPFLDAGVQNVFFLNSDAKSGIDVRYPDDNEASKCS